MKRHTEPARIAWALVWRSTLLAPVFLVLYALGVATWFARFLFPPLILLSAWARDGALVGILGTTWILAMALWRWSRFRALWEKPPSYL